MRCVRVLALFGAIVGVVAVDHASAAIINISTTIGAWKDAGFIELGDKRFTISDGDLATNFDDSTTVNGFTNNKVWSITLSGLDQSIGTGPWTRHIDYDVTIFTGPRKFETVRAESNNLFGSTTVTKTIDGVEVLTSSDGDPSDVWEVPSTYATTMHIRDDISVGTDGVLASFSNTFTQTGRIQGIPEPSTAVLLLAGAAALGLVTRHRRKTIS